MNGLKMRGSPLRLNANGLMITPKQPLQKLNGLPTLPKQPKLKMTGSPLKMRGSPLRLKPNGPKISGSLMRLKLRLKPNGLKINGLQTSRLKINGLQTSKLKTTTPKPKLQRNIPTLRRRNMQSYTACLHQLLEMTQMKRVLHGGMVVITLQQKYTI